MYKLSVISFLCFQTLANAPEEILDLLQNKYPALVLVQSTVEFTSTQPLFDNEVTSAKEDAYLYLKAKLQNKELRLCSAEKPEDIEYLGTLAKPGITNCLFQKTYAGEETMCRSPTQPVLIQEKLTQDAIKCGECGGTLYASGFLNCHTIEFFRIRMEERRTSMEALHAVLGPKYDPSLELVYKVCFNVGLKKPIWTKHQVKASSKPGPIPLPVIISDNWNEISTDPYDIKDLDEQFFHEFRASFLNQEKSNDPAIMQMMVPKADMAPSLWQLPTNHMINIGSLSQNLQPLMNAINNGIRTAAIQVKQQSPKVNLFIDKSTLRKKYELQIYTKTMSQNGSETDAWCKLVYHEEKKLSILIFLHNTPHITRSSLKKYCSWKILVTCDFSKWDETLNKKHSSLYLAYCCKASKEKIKEIFSFELETKGTLDIQGLITKKSEKSKQIFLDGKTLRKEYGGDIEKTIDQLK